mgnify:CR=1 FL=1
MRCSHKIRGCFERIDREVRTDDLTVMAVDTVVRFFDFRWVVSFDIIFRGIVKDIARAESNAVTAAFTPFRDDVHDSS